MADQLSNNPLSDEMGAPATAKEKRLHHVIQDQYKRCLGSIRNLEYFIESLDRNNPGVSEKESEKEERPPYSVTIRELPENLSFLAGKINECTEKLSGILM